MSSRVLCLLSAGVLLAQTAADPKDTARKALDLLLAHKYSEMTPLFSAPGKTANPEAKLAAMVPDSWGALQTVGTASLRTIGTASIVNTPVKFANQEVNFEISINGEGQIGLIIPRVDPWKHPDYSKPDSFKEREVTVGTQWKLAATVTVPNGAGPFPGVVLVHDTGLGDRDEQNGAVKVFKDLAEGLASKGVVVLRYEKRTRAYPSVTQREDYTAETEIIDDAVLAAAVLRAQPEVKPGRVFALGFGLGGYLLPRVAESDGKLAGMIVVNGNERPLEDLFLDEAMYIDEDQEKTLKGPQLEQWHRQLELFKEQAAKIKKLNQGDVDTVPLLGMKGPYLIDLKGYDPAGQAKLLKLPMLILQGERDYQVNMKDFAAWKSGLTGLQGVTMKSYPSLDHVLAEGTGRSVSADYRKPGQHVAQPVIDDIAKWVSQ
ncbi:MAG: dienelactone hydrolase family protein [Ignavibacteriota bacterium]